MTEPSNKSLRYAALSAWGLGLYTDNSIFDVIAWGLFFASFVKR